jgi:hypothetical protein
MESFTTSIRTILSFLCVFDFIQNWSINFLFYLLKKIFCLNYFIDILFFLIEYMHLLLIRELARWIKSILKAFGFVFINRSVRKISLCMQN